jgi:hypothetical protein
MGGSHGSSPERGKRGKEEGQGAPRGARLGALCSCVGCAVRGLLCVREKKRGRKERRKRKGRKRKERKNNKKYGKFSKLENFQKIKNNLSS